jgi:Endonuclease IV (EC 3.1.21.-)
LDSRHIHISGIEYGKKGEIKHLNLEESDLNYVEILRALKDFRVKGVVISESPNIEEDAILMKKKYESI